MTPLQRNDQKAWRYALGVGDEVTLKSTKPGEPPYIRTVTQTNDFIVVVGTSMYARSTGEFASGPKAWENYEMVQPE